jgi:hypothetical protein
MIVQDNQTANNPVTLDVRQTVYYEESFEINFHFPVFNEASWRVLESGHGWVQIYTDDVDAIKHAKELLEYTGEDHLKVTIDGTEEHLLVSFDNDNELHLVLDIHMDDMDCYDTEITMEII